MMMMMMEITVAFVVQFAFFFLTPCFLFFCVV